MRALHIDDVRDLMCLQNPSLTAEKAADILKDLYPNEPYGWIMEHTRCIAEVREIVATRRAATRCR